jgi:hypothetical protein
MANVPVPTLSGALYDVALECASKREHKKCRKKFNDPACQNCKHYIYNYITGDPDPKAVNLLMYQAESTICSVNDDNRFSTAVLWIPIIAFCAFVVWQCTAQNNPRYAGLPDEPPANGIQQKQTKLEQHDNIVYTLRVVEQFMFSGIDVNDDGLVNCIDAAVIFYEFFPHRDKVCIEINKNPRTGMNHLFNCVYTDGVWVAIEPQAYIGGIYSYRMHEEWGAMYDSAFNRDATSAYLRFVR